MKFRITFFIVALTLFSFTLPILAGDNTAEEYKSHIRSTLEVEDCTKTVEICDEAVESEQEENR